MSPRRSLARLKTFGHALHQSRPVQFALRHKRAIGIIIIVAFLAFLAYYLTAHPEVFDSILRLSPLTIVILLVSYTVAMLANAGILYATVRVLGKRMPGVSGLLLSMYSTIVNFFGPLQSGPAVRAVYLKTKLGIRVRDFTYATLFYYLAYGALGASFLFVAVAPWLTVLGILAGIALTIFGVWRFGLKDRAGYVLLIFALTLVQVLAIFVIYTTELYTVAPDAHYSLLQTLSYTGSANLALFVSFTPGAIGVREAFLVFAQSLHHVSLSSIIAAGVLDRAFYIVYLVALFLLSGALHLGRTFRRGDSGVETPIEK